MKAAVIVFPGSNCDRDIAVALEKSMGKVPKMVWHRDTELPNLDLIVVPGGFSYGDYLRSGAMAAYSPIMKDIKLKAEAGVRVLGICNGFQILTETGLLPGVLMRNRDLKFICRDVHLQVTNNTSAFTSGYKAGEVIRIPVAHHEGNYFADEKTLKALEDESRIAFRYCDENGKVNDCANVNGSQHNIAGVFNKSKTVLGMMPHPERLADDQLGGTGGRAMFDGLVEALA
ncbi:MAG TPA: phosphoribosylformylglycinamidine synthase subunit PurQ [Rhodospirillaceae bacterium]|nr:phosphoribosylformylglycinamidine synthase I [Candidatus Neomarinimicrobiota bacterium]HCX15057.1 phosphoribosylformylglycinamidine synthase subunit PurQ [Rhodospirillaceae bacterium]